MFESLTGKFQDIFRRLKGEGALSEKALDESLKEILNASVSSVTATLVQLGLWRWVESSAHRHRPG